MSLFAKDILALDWDHRQLRAVSARVAKGQVTVRRMFQESIPPEAGGDDPAVFGRWLAGVLGKHHCGRMRTVVAIPRDQVVLKNLLLPAATPTLEIAALVQFQMQKELPFGAEDAVIDYTIAVDANGRARGKGNGNGKGKQAPTAAAVANGAGGPAAMSSAPTGAQQTPAAPQKELLVAATRREVIEYYRKVAQSADLVLGRIGLRCFSNLQTVLACAPDAVRLRMLLVNVGPELTEIDLIQGGGLLFSRSASVPLSEQDDTTEFLNRLTLEVIRSVQAARATVADLEPDAVVVAAPDRLAETIADRLGQRLDAKAWVLEPGRAIRLPADHRKGAGEFSAALGLALGETGATAAPFNFLNPHRPVDLVARRNRHRRLAGIAAAGAVAVALTGNVALLTAFQMPIDRHEQEVKKLERDADKIKSLNRDIAAIRSDLQAAPVWLAELKKINDIWMEKWHKDAYVTLFSGNVPERGGWEIHLAGSARRNDVIIAITEELRKMYPGQQVEPKPPSVRQGEEFAYSFDLTIRQPPPAGKPKS